MMVVAVVTCTTSMLLAVFASFFINSDPTSTVVPIPTAIHRGLRPAHVDHTGDVPDRLTPDPQRDHLIEHPMEGIWSLGPWPVSPIRRIASRSSGTRSAASPFPALSRRPRY